MMWQLRLFEVWLTARLIRSPTFNRMVRGVHKKVHEMRHGPDLEEMGGTKIDNNHGFSASKFIQHFRDEVRDQIRGTTKK